MDLNFFDPSQSYVRYTNKAYRIFCNNEKFKIKSCACTLPFGFEKFNGKIIANLEIDISNNESYNYVTSIKNIDKNFEKKQVFGSEQYKNEIQNLYFISSIKERQNNKVHHRCHIKNPKTFPISFLELKDKKFTADIELSNVWINGDTYGIVWMIENIIIQI